MTGRLHQISVSASGGVPKYAVPEAMIHATGVWGDKQRNLKYHGGPMRAVCLYSLERIHAMQAEGHPIQPGTTGENLTVEGIDWDQLGIGDRFVVGDVELEMTQFTVPCRNIAGSFADGDSLRISQELHPGWARIYTRVIKPGVVRVGDCVTWSPASWTD